LVGQVQMLHVFFSRTFPQFSSTFPAPFHRNKKGAGVWGIFRH